MSDSVPQAAPTKGGVVAYLSIEGAMEAVKFYQKAFGAELAALVPPDDKGRTMHAHIYVNGSSIMFSDFFPEHGHVPVPAQAFNLMIPTDNIDADWQRAVDAGCTGTLPPADMFWGDRYGQVKDPYGVVWAFNQGAYSAGKSA